MKMFEGDLLPVLTVAISDDAGPVDLSGASAVRVIGVQNHATLFDRILDDRPEDGVLTMDWEDGDTDNPGDIMIEIRVTWGGNKPQTFRPEDVVEVVSSFSEAIDG